MSNTDPIVGRTEYVKFPNAAPHKPQLQHGELTYPTFKKDLSVYAFVYFCVSFLSKAPLRPEGGWGNTLIDALIIQNTKRLSA